MSTNQARVSDAPTDARTTHRLFFALAPNGDVRRMLSALAGDVARMYGGRRPRAENLHLTVAFLGDVPIERMPVVLEIGAAAAESAQPFALTLDRVGVFRDAGIAWAAVQSIPPPLRRIFEALQEGISAAGLRAERRAFHAHVTLARRCTKPLPDTTMASIAWPVEALVLMASTTLPDGPRYSELASWRLVPGGHWDRAE